MSRHAPALQDGRGRCWRLPPAAAGSRVAWREGHLRVLLLASAVDPAGRPGAFLGPGDGPACGPTGGAAPGGGARLGAMGGYVVLANAHAGSVEREALDAAVGVLAAAGPTEVRMSSDP